MVLPDKFITIEDIATEWGGQRPEELQDAITRLVAKELASLTSSKKVHRIKGQNFTIEQRLAAFDKSEFFGNVRGLPFGGLHTLEQALRFVVSKLDDVPAVDKEVANRISDLEDEVRELTDDIDDLLDRVG